MVHSRSNRISKRALQLPHPRLFQEEYSLYIARLRPPTAPGSEVGRDEEVVLALEGLLVSHEAMDVTHVLKRRAVGEAQVGREEGLAEFGILRRLKEGLA